MEFEGGEGRVGGGVEGVDVCIRVLASSHVVPFQVTSDENIGETKTTYFA